MHQEFASMMKTTLLKHFQPVE